MLRKNRDDAATDEFEFPNLTFAGTVPIFLVFDLLKAKHHHARCPPLEGEACDKRRSGAHPQGAGNILPFVHGVANLDDWSPGYGVCDLSGANNTNPAFALVFVDFFLRVYDSPKAHQNWRPHLYVVHLLSLGSSELAGAAETVIFVPIFLSRSSSFFNQ